MPSIEKPGGKPMPLSLTCTNSSSPWRTNAYMHLGLVPAGSVGHPAARVVLAARMGSGARANRAFGQAWPLRTAVPPLAGVAGQKRARPHFVPTR